ncbi:protein-lysine N-methyltransferase EEF2KMT isoform X2 [Carcharodon carcharias]|uniref:protein-lysine N-methyltransferase EEF2KMT isoform X2 n=1 Tax=Carcharodon carcharias TaxID=13397 RepID=UPI001B7EAB2C|nr:protein-lysine N-methyltransferase EEF2KMT isoform X2 [Carcharodon carcharias]
MSGDCGAAGAVLRRRDRDLLLSFQHSFFTMRRMDSLPLELEERLKNSKDSTLLQQILQQTVLHPLCNKYPPSVKYRRLFLAELIKKHEMTSTEPLDDLYDALGEVLRSEELKMCHKNYFLLSGENIRLGENVAIISEGTTGLVTWEAAQFFAEWAMENSEVFNCRTILELGSGIGLTGITICKTCAPKEYIFSDCHPNVLQQLRKNILSNGLLLDSETWNPKDCEVEVENNKVSEENQRPKITVVGLEWSEVTQEQVAELQSDIIIASDVIYDPEVVLCLVSVLEKFLISGEKERSSVVYLASTIRNPETYHQFKMELDRVGIGHQVITGPTRKVFPYNRCTKIELLKIHHET